AMRRYVDAPRRGETVAAAFDGQRRLIGYVPAGAGTRGLVVRVGLALPGGMAGLDRTAMAGFALVLAGMLASLAVALWAGQRFVRRPTAALLAVARRWSAGDLAARADLAEAAGSEFGSLALAFNKMASTLDHEQAELRELNATLEQRVGERTRDLTESRNRLQVEMAEREKTETSLRQAQKLQAVGQLAGGIAHDFNNLLTAVLGALDLLRARLPAGQENLVRLVDNARHAAERGGKLTSQLLAFSRHQQLLPVPTDLNLAIVTLTNLLGSTLGRSIRIQTDLVQDLWPAMVDPSQIEAAIINLAINARDAMPQGGVLTIGTRNLTLGVGGNVAAGDYVAVRVGDTGTGMTPEVLGRLFEPFFTTKDIGRGSGLGLSQVHGLAVQSGGDVRVESRLGEGSTFTLLLPRAHALPAAAGPDSGAGRVMSRRRARILVVDDDSDVRQMIGEMLAERGYAVVTTAGAAEALAVLEQDGGFDAMLVDYIMPGRSGVALIEAVRAIRPAMRVLLMTGHVELRAGEAVGAENIIRKPFNVATLDERLEQLLARPVLRAVPDSDASSAG
ncbi:MAG: response regulator, partial [Rhodospirillales bacterium]|nr:response regulator [Rhodospirillales bacterium]